MNFCTMYIFLLFFSKQAKGNSLTAYDSRLVLGTRVQRQAPNLTRVIRELGNNCGVSEVREQIWEVK